MRRRKRSERGEGQMGCIFGLILFVAVIFACYRMIPVKVKAAELRQEVFDEAKSAGTHSDERIRKGIVLKARDLDLPLDEKDVKIRRAANTINIDVDYVVPVDLGLFKYKWSFHHSAENPIF